MTISASYTTPRDSILVRDYEARIDVSEAMIYAGMSSSILRRIVHP